MEHKASSQAPVVMRPPREGLVDTRMHTASYARVSASVPLIGCFREATMAAAHLSDQGSVRCTRGQGGRGGWARPLAHLSALSSKVWQHPGRLRTIKATRVRCSRASEPDALRTATMGAAPVMESAYVEREPAAFFTIISEGGTVQPPFSQGRGAGVLAIPLSGRRRKGKVGWRAGSSHPQSSAASSTASQPPHSCMASSTLMAPAGVAAAADNALAAQSRLLLCSDWGR